MHVYMFMSCEHDCDTTVARQSCDNAIASIIAYCLKLVVPNLNNRTTVFLLPRTNRRGHFWSLYIFHLSRKDMRC